MTRGKSVLKTVETEYGPVEYDSDMPVGSLRKLFGAASTGDLAAIIDGLSSFVTKWPFDGSPKNAENWDKLRRSEFGEVTQAIMKDLGDSGE